MSTKQKQTDGTGARKRDGLWMIPGCLGMVVLNAAISYGIVRLNTPVTVAFNMKQTVDAFFDSAGQKKLTEAQSKALSGRFNAALEASLQAWQREHLPSFWFHRRWYRARRISPGRSSRILPGG